MGGPFVGLGFFISVGSLCSKVCQCRTCGKAWPLPWILSGCGLLFDYIVKNKATVRFAAGKFEVEQEHDVYGCSKTKRFWWWAA